MKCDKLNSLFCLHKKKRKSLNPSPVSDCSFRSEDDDYAFDGPKMVNVGSEGFPNATYEVLNSYVDGCFMPVWDHVTEYKHRTEFKCLNEIVNVDELWEDPSGVMELNSRQKKRFFCWIRYFNLCDNLHFFKSLPSYDRILQGYVGDCSTVSGLSSLAEYEKLNSSVLSDKIKLIDLPKTVQNLKKLKYPERSIDYLKRYKLAIGVKIYFNGCARCMFVDDWIPIRKDNTLLCAHSSDPGELWVTLFEKAIVRLFGKSYSIKGTNPGIDIYHLTGWIPEILQLPPYRYKIPNDSLVKQLNSNAALTEDRHDIVNVNKWDMIWNNIVFNYNRNFVVCLGTNDLYDVATNENYIEGISVSSGIVSGHAYSVLDVVDLEFEGERHRLLLLKNPWGKISSKLKLDPKVVDLLPYHRPSGDENAEDDDDGIFWIEWTDVLKWFSHLYLCWNFEMFEFTNKAYFNWGRNDHFLNSPVPEDSYLSLYNPQLLLTSQLCDHCVSKQSVEANPSRRSADKSVEDGGVGLKEGTVDEDAFVIYGILIQNKKTLNDKMKYLALHTFEGNERVITPNNPAVNGVYNNSEVILCKLLVASKNGNKQDNLLRYGKYNLIETMNSPVELVVLLCHFMKKIVADGCFTMVTFSNRPLKLQLVPSLTDGCNNLVYDYKWSEYNNGTNPNQLWSFFSNPHFRIELKKDMNMILLLETDSEVSVNLRLFFGRMATVRGLRTKQAISSKEYKLYCCEIHGFFRAGIYTLIPSNFNGIEANFRFNVFHDGGSDECISIYPIPYPYIKLGKILDQLSTGCSCDVAANRGVEREFKIDLSNANQALNDGSVRNSNELLDGAVRRYKVLNYYNIGVVSMIEDYIDFKVDAPALASIRIKVNTVNDNKFVLFSKRCKDYPAYSPNAGRCLGLICEDKGGSKHKRSNDMDLDSEYDKCVGAGSTLKFCSDLCCVKCGGACGQFYPTDPKLFDLECKLGFEYSVFSDLNGGISKNGRTPSNSSQVLFLKENVVNFSLVNLFPNVQYRLLSVNRFRLQTVVFISNDGVISLI